MVQSEMRHKKRAGARGALREVVECAAHMGAAEAGEGAEVPPLFPDNSSNLHVHAVQWTQLRCVLHGDHHQGGDGHLDCVFELGSDH